MQQVALRDWETIKQLRKATAEGLLSKEEFKILLCPQLFIVEEREGSLPPGTERRGVDEKSPEPKEIGFRDSEEKI